MMMPGMPDVVKIESFHVRVSVKSVVICRVETWIDAKGRYHILVSERGDNPGPSITQSHEALRQELERFLKIPKHIAYRFFERFDSASYAPPRDDLSEVCEVVMRQGKPHWEFVPDDEWYLIYAKPREPVPQIKTRKKDGK